MALGIYLFLVIWMLKGRWDARRKSYIVEDHAHANEDRTNDRHNPMHSSLRRPSVPEQANWRAQATRYHGWQSVLWLWITTVLRGQYLGDGIRSHATYDASQHRADAYAECCQASLAARETVLAIEYDLESSEAEIEIAIYDSGVEGKQEDDRG